MVTFSISGLWHGANWTYVVWGALNDAYLIGGRMTGAWSTRALAALGLTRFGAFKGAVAMSITFFLTCMGWVVFRASSVSDAGYILTHFWQNWDFASIKTEQFLMRQMPVALASIVLLECIQFLGPRLGIPSFLRQLPILPRWIAYSGFVYLVLLFGVFRNAQFIYFQF